MSLERESEPAKRLEQIAWRTRSLVYGLLGPVRGCIAPLVCAVERTAELLFFLHVAMDEIQLGRDIYAVVAARTGKSTCAAARQITRLANLCWDAIESRGETMRYLGKKSCQLHAPGEMLVYLAFLAYFGRPFYPVVREQPLLLFGGKPK